MHPKLRNLLINILKFVVAGGLISWLISQDKLTAQSFTIFFEMPYLLPGYFVAWMIGPIAMGSARWLFLLRGADFHVSYMRCTALTLIGVFFNNAMPGSVGGDLVKGYYVTKGQKDRTRIVVSLLIDRLIGLFGLVSVGCIALSTQIGEIWKIVALRPLVLFSYSVFICFICLFSFVLYSPEVLRKPFEKALSLDIPGISILRKIYDSLMVYRNHPKSIFFGYFFSVSLQSLVVSYIVLLTLAICNTEQSFFSLAAIIPICVLTTAIPIAPGGLGVGHIAFDNIFGALGVAGGANVFTTFFISQLLLSLLGSIPYLFYKHQIQDQSIQSSPVNS